MNNLLSGCDFFSTIAVGSFFKTINTFHKKAKKKIDDALANLIFLELKLFNGKGIKYSASLLKNHVVKETKKTNLQRGNPHRDSGTHKKCGAARNPK